MNHVRSCCICVGAGALLNVASHSYSYCGVLERMSPVENKESQQKTSNISRISAASVHSVLTISVHVGIQLGIILKRNFKEKSKPVHKLPVSKFRERCNQTSVPVKYREFLLKGDTISFSTQFSSVSPCKFQGRVRMLIWFSIKQSAPLAVQLLTVP